MHEQSAPLIGIPLSLDAQGRLRPGCETQYLDTSYARAVLEAGGVPVHLPIQDDPLPLLRRLNGLLVPGGDDFLPPDPYPEPVSFEPVPRAQHDFDARTLAAALEAKIPVLGICYGMQLLALHHGGELHHHIPSDLPAAGDHKTGQPNDRHGVVIEAGTLLAGILGRDPVAVNSRHHQAVATPGNGLRVSARADDGVIEAIEAERGAFCLGVQWHPETMDGEHRRALFSAFVTAALQTG